MPKHIFIESGEPDGLPEWQSPESIKRLVSQAKTGDVIHIIPQGQKQAFCESQGLSQIHGCVDEQSTNDNLVLWSTYFVINPDAFRSDEARSFKPEDIRLIKVDKAETYIEKATEGMFKYGDEAKITIPDKGDFVIRVDSLFNGILSGVTPDGQRVTGGLNHFHPY